MRHVFSLFLVLGCLFGLCLYVGASDVGTAATLPPSTEPTVPVVALDGESIQAIADALVPSEPTGDTSPDDTEFTVPQVELSPDTVEALSQAVGVSVGDALAEAASSDVPVPYAASGISGGYYFVADCALGAGVKFWVPADFAMGSLALDDNGIINMTNSNVYIMPDSSSLQSYSIYASRFGHFQYRRSNYDYADLTIRNITDTNISFLENTTKPVQNSTYFVIIISILLLVGLFLVFLKRG